MPLHTRLVKFIITNTVSFTCWDCYNNPAALFSQVICFLGFIYVLIPKNNAESFWGERSFLTRAGGWSCSVVRICEREGEVHWPKPGNSEFMYRASLQWKKKRRERTYTPLLNLFSISLDLSSSRHQHCKAKVLIIALITRHRQEEIAKGGNVMFLAWSVNQEGWLSTCVALILFIFLYLFCVTGTKYAWWCFPWSFTLSVEPL